MEALLYDRKPSRARNKTNAINTKQTINGRMIIHPCTSVLLMENTKIAG
jgi:hypothetical protein